MSPRPERQLESWQRLRFFEALAQAFRSAAPLVLVRRRSAVGRRRHDRMAPVTSCAPRPTRAAWSSARCARKRSRTIRRSCGCCASFEHDDLLTAIALGPLDRTATAQLAGEVAEQPLDEDDAGARRFAKPRAIRCSSSNGGAWSSARQPGASDRRRAAAGAVGGRRATGAALGGGAGRRGSGGGDRTRLPFDILAAGQRPRGRRAGARARRALAAAHRPRSGGRAVGLQPRSHPRGRLQRNRPGAPPADPSAHRAGRWRCCSPIGSTT